MDKKLFIVFLLIFIHYQVGRTLCCNKEEGSSSPVIHVSEEHDWKDEVCTKHQATLSIMRADEGFKPENHKIAFLSTDDPPIINNKDVIQIIEGWYGDE